MSIPAVHPFDFDPTYGFGLDALLALRPPSAPLGFDGFWRARLAQALGMKPNPRLSDSAVSHSAWRVHDIAYTSTGGVQIGGWLLIPRTGEVRRGLVVGHGYGGRDAPEFDIPVNDTAILFPCLRGLSLSRLPGVPDDPGGHVLQGIGDPDRSILGGCVEDVWLAVSALHALFPGLEGIGYSGISFGGGIGALAVAFDDRIDCGHLTVPTFGNIPLWLNLPTIGSGAAVQAYAKTHPEVVDTLALFDAAVAATRIAQPMLTAVARFDPAVAPPCQFSIANALASSKRNQTVILDAGHFDYPGMATQHALLAEKVGRLFSPDETGLSPLV